MTDADDEKLAESTLLSHLLELRDRILRALVATLVIALPCLYFANEIFTWISAPLRAQLPEGARLIATSVVAPFMTPFKLALLAAFFFAMPVILYQVWAFVAPGPVQARAAVRAAAVRLQRDPVLRGRGLRVLRRVPRDLQLLRDDDARGRRDDDGHHAVHGLRGAALLRLRARVRDSGRDRAARRAPAS